jgi:tRNA-splicing ligase RtcB (3'-phosphate/5'-hydroxy nucleic acid ligase)
MQRKPDALEVRARELCTAAGIEPDSRRGEGVGPTAKRGHPAWTEYRDAAHKERVAVQQKTLADELAAMTVPPQTEAYADAPLAIVGDHEENTITQMRNCMKVGNVVGGVLCADGHLGYAQPVGGVIAYEDHISVSGIGFDIGCGNMAARLDTKFEDVAEHIPTIIRDVQKTISFGVGRTNDEKVEHPLFDLAELWRDADMEFYRAKAEGQLGTVGSGNHYVDIMRDEDGFVWIGVHFGSRGLGHTSATKYVRLAGGKDGINVAPTVLDVHSEVGKRYIAAMGLAGQYAYAGREWVVERVRQMIGGSVTEMVHNHHNYAWQEEHNGRKLWVVRKGATPAFPGQRGFIGGSMGDDAVIIEGVDGPEARSLLYSTVHGAGRTMGRKAAIRKYTQAEMDAWLQGRGVTLVGGAVDESPMAYRRLPEVLAYHAGSVRVLHTLRPFAVAMAGDGEFDPWRD